MKAEQKVVVVSITFGILSWIIDALLDALIFYDGAILELLITNIPPHELYIRLVIFAGFVAFGVLISSVLGRQRRAEEALALERAELRATLYSIGDAVIATDEVGRVARMNQLAEQLTGWSEAEAIDRPLEKREDQQPAGGPPDLSRLVSQDQAVDRPADDPRRSQLDDCRRQRGQDAAGQDAGVRPHVAQQPAQDRLHWSHRSGLASLSAARSGTAPLRLALSAAWSGSASLCRCPLRLVLSAGAGPWSFGGSAVCVPLWPGRTFACCLDHAFPSFAFQQVLFHRRSLDVHDECFSQSLSRQIPVLGELFLVHKVVNPVAAPLSANESQVFEYA